MRVSSIASWVEFDPAEAMTGTRPLRLLDDGLDDFGVLLVRKGGRFPCGAARDQTVTPHFFDVVVDQRGEPGEVDAQVVIEWCDQRDDDPA